MLFIPFNKKFEAVFSSESKWYKKYLWFVLFFLFYFGYFAVGMREDGLKLKQGALFSLGCFFFYVTLTMFFVMQGSDRIKRIRSGFLKFLVACIGFFALICWLIITGIWILNLTEGG